MFEKPSILKPKKIKRRKQVILGIKIAAGVLSIFFFVGFLSWLSSIRLLTIHTVEVSGNAAVSTEDIEASVEQSLSGESLKIFSKANIFLYSKASIVDALKQFTWIKDATIHRKGLNTIVVEVTERTPSAVWCGTSVETSEDCRLLDNHGAVFALAPDFSGAAYLKVYGPVATSSDNTLHFFNESGVIHIFNFTKTLLTINLVASRVEVTDSHEYTVFLKSGTQIFVDTEDIIDKTVSNIQALLSEKDFVESAKSGFKNLTYIDARFGNKLYYKFNLGSISTSTEQ